MADMEPLRERPSHDALGMHGLEELWEIIEGAASIPIRRILRAHRLDPGLADDVLQELTVYLLERPSASLGRFRGSSEAQLRRFVWIIAARFASRLIARWQLQQAREAEALGRCPPPDRDGPGEPQVRAAVAELEALLSESDRTHLRIILAREGIIAASGIGAERLAGPLSARTLHRWVEALSRALVLHGR
jgi:hypothetical protein